MTTKTCKGPCGETKNVTEFSARKGSVDGYRNQCKKCTSSQHKTWQQSREVPLFTCDGKPIVCRVCGTEKSCDEYEIRTDSQVRRKDCKDCRSSQNKEWRDNNPERILENNRRNYDENKEVRLAYAKNYRNENREVVHQKNIEYRETHRKELSARSVEYTRERLKHDPVYKLKRNLRSRINNAIHNQYGEKAASSMELIGCTIQEVRGHIESQFVEGMTWDNHGEWHIDHIRPCASFNLEDPEEQKKCFHFTNLQPLWAEDNLKKGSRYLKF
jgi:hypothetical protein